MEFRSAQAKPALATVAIFILLLSGTIFAYATRVQPVNAHPDNPGIPSNISEVFILFKLLPLNLTIPVPPEFRNGSGQAVITPRDTDLRTNVMILNSTPHAELEVKMIIAQNGHNESISVGEIETDSNGNGILLNKEVDLKAGIYDIGLQVFDTSTFDSKVLVMKSDPQSVQVTLPHNAVVSSSTFSTSTSFSTSFSTHSEFRCNSNISESDDHEFESLIDGLEHRGKTILGFNIVPLPVWLKQIPPIDYPFKVGASAILADGSTLRIFVAFLGLPNTTYTIALTANNRNITLANPLTTSCGDAKIKTEVKLEAGKYDLGILVFLGNEVKQDKLVGLSVPRSLSATLPESTRTSTITDSESGHKLEFKIVPAAVQDAPNRYAFGRGEAEIAADGGTLKLKMEIEQANPLTHFNIVLSINGTNKQLGSLATNDEGDGKIRALLKLAPGTYSLGILVYDLSNFNVPTLVMSSSPSTRLIVIVTDQSSTTFISETRHEKSLTTVTADEEDESEIRSAIDNKTIPAVVHVSGSNATFSVLDPRFSVSVGKRGDNGLIISISVENITGPRVLLLNLTQNSFLNLSSYAINITLDGDPVVQASSVTQVLNPLPTDPSRYVIVATSSGFQLLVSIPHFSLRVIEIIPIPLDQIRSILAVNIQILAASVLVITLLFAALYKARSKVFSLF
jgi:hypothetical protein